MVDMNKVRMGNLNSAIESLYDNQASGYETTGIDELDEALDQMHEAHEKAKGLAANAVEMLRDTLQQRLTDAGEI